MVIAAPALFRPKQATLPVKSFLQRLMLVTDGRITDIVQAYSGETVEAVKLHQTLNIRSDRFLKQSLMGETTGHINAWGDPRRQPLPKTALLRSSTLQLDRDYQLMERSILLQGTTSKTNYLYADSQIVLERLDAKIRNELIFSRQPIDKLLRENKVETYREILDCGIAPAGVLAQYFNVDPASEIIYRTYLVLINGLPVLQITEKFPTTHFIA